MQEVLTKKDLISKIHKMTGLKRTDVAIVIDSFILAVEESLKNGDSVQLHGFGTFKTELRRPKLCRNVAKGEPLYIPGRVVPVFNVGERLKRIVTRQIKSV